MVWVTAKNRSDKIATVRWVVQASLGTICILWPLAFLNRFWVLFVAIFILVVATYLGSQNGAFGRLSKNGIFGGVWLTIPIYVYLLQNT